MKNTIIRYISYLMLPALFSLLFSCTPGSCLDETEAYVKATMYQYKPPKKKAPDSLTVYGLGIDTSFIYKTGTNVNIAKLPLNSSADSSTFIIMINNFTDTVTFRYTSFPYLISKECGYTFYHNITGIPEFTKNLGIDSISIIKNTITNLNEENIRIFY
jgi:hypothetical protein